MMRMKGHAIHDAAQYVPPELFEYWRKRDPIARFEQYLLAKQWLTPQQNQELIAGVERELEADREAALSSPLPAPETATVGVYCHPGCHTIEVKYGTPQVQTPEIGRAHV